MKKNNIFFSLILLLIVVLLFTIIDYLIHGLESAWGVPDYYFRNKIPAAFLWGVIGLILTKKIQSIWLKSMAVSGIIAVSLQIRYFLAGYALSFVLLFLLLHFIILCLLLSGMFLVFKKYQFKLKD